MAYRSSDLLRNTVVSIAMSFDELRQIDEYCEEHNVSRSELMRDAVKIVLWMRADDCRLHEEKRKSDIDEYFDAMEAEKKGAADAHS